MLITEGMSGLSGGGLVESQVLVPGSFGAWATPGMLVAKALKAHVELLDVIEEPNGDTLYCGGRWGTATPAVDSYVEGAVEGDRTLMTPMLL